jgi:hypothetical protein
MGLQLKSNSNALECDNRSAFCVITQQYFSGAFSLLSDFRKKNSG